jgi:hypothetical protein
MDDREYRRRLIARVEALRREALMTRSEFHSRIGAVASGDWIEFTAASDKETSQYFSLKAISRICEAFGIGTELLQFRS